MGRARIAILVLGVVGLMAGLAGARSSPSKPYFNGRLADGVHRGMVSFRGDWKHGRVTTVVHFGWSNVPITCTQGSFHLTPDHFRFAMKVRRHSRVFQAHARAHTRAGDSGWFNWRVVGHFRPGFRRAHGEFSAWGDYSPRATNCHTGKLSWTAIEFGPA